MIRRLALLSGMLSMMAQLPALAGDLPAKVEIPQPLMEATAPAVPAARATSSDPKALWSAYKAQFLKPEGRIVDNGNGDVSHSEGQGYGLLLAALMEDRPAFDRIWSWTARELMVRKDHLAAWRWVPGATPHVADTNNATDGDLLIAWALVEGATRFSRPELRTAAQAIARDIGRKLVKPSPYGPILMPGEKGFGAKEQVDGPVVNLSYWVFPAIEKIAPLAPEVDWDAVERGGLALLHQSRFGPARLPANWISLAGSGPAPAKAYPARFGYDAIRIPLYLAWSGSDQKAIVGVFGTLWASDGDIGPYEIDLATGNGEEVLGGFGFKAVAALAACLTSNSKIPAAVLAANDDRYYPATLQALTNVLVRERFPQCL